MKLTHYYAIDIYNILNYRRHEKPASYARLLKVCRCVYAAGIKDVLDLWIYLMHEQGNKVLYDYDNVLTVCEHLYKKVKQDIPFTDYINRPTKVRKRRQYKLFLADGTEVTKQQVKAMYGLNTEQIYYISRHPEASYSHGITAQFV